ncbi:hypothetical protein ACFL0L_02305 [Patescibacteria group bacterium]
MKKIYITSIIIVAGFFILSLSAFAHQPSVVGDETSITVEDPEISKAYYAELVGEPVHYVFTASEEFDLYVNVLVPDIANSTEDYTATVTRDDEVVTVLEPGSAVWSQFDEPFGGDVYRMGPEYRATGLAGEYDITVSSPDNHGKYVLAIGEVESFPAKEIMRTMAELYGVKKFFGKSGLAIFESPFIYGPAIVLVLVIALVAWLVIRKRKKKNNK